MSAPSIVPIERWHFDFFLSQTESDSLSGRAIGRTLVSSDQTPLGFGGVYFDENAHGQAVAIVFFYGGPNNVFARKYLPMVLRAMRDVVRILIGMGIETIYAIADPQIPSAVAFIGWMGGTLLDADDPGGPVYGIELAKIPMISRD